MVGVEVSTHHAVPGQLCPETLEGRGIPGGAGPDVDAGHRGVCGAQADGHSRTLHWPFRNRCQVHNSRAEGSPDVHRRSGLSGRVPRVPARPALAGTQPAGSGTQVAHITWQAWGVDDIHLLEGQDIIWLSQQLLHQLSTPPRQGVAVPLQNSRPLAATTWSPSHGGCW